MHFHYYLLLVTVFLLFNFTFPSLSLSFFPSKNVTLYGDASLSGNTISLTQEHSCRTPSSSSSSGVGRVMYIYPIRFLDAKAKSTASFSCYFSFTYIPKPLCPYGDGIAFLITSNPDSYSLLTGYMGLPPARPDKKDSFFAVEFDTSYDPSLGDINGNHVGVDVNTVISLASVDVVPHGVDLRSGKKVTAWIEYRHDMKNVKVWAGHTTTRPASPILVAQVDLSSQLKQFMHVGFTASNGKGSGIFVIQQWQFKTNSSSHPFTPTEGECFLCDLEHREREPIDSYRKRERLEEIVLGVGGVTAFGLSILAVAVVIVILLRRKRRVMGRRGKESQTCSVEMSKIPIRLSLDEIKSATKGFNRERLVGEGASAKVYRGLLPTGEVAVKRFGVRKIDSLSLHNPFTNEFATMVGCLRHKNLVQLQGWCCEGHELVLVYEYLPHGSLNKILENKSDSPLFLSWNQRLNIVLGVASALAYLHEECEMQIIHRDVKTCNIMVDSDFNAKLGDFGLAEVHEHNTKAREATIPAGTKGYLAPEYVYSGVASVKTDVYSFGIVVLEVATGRKPVTDNGMLIVEYAWKLWENKKIMEAADPGLMGRFDRKGMERMLVVGLVCAHPHHEKRPMAKDAARMLRGEVPLPLLPHSKPRVRVRPVLPGDSCEELDVVADERSSLDDGSFMTPRSCIG